MLKIFISAGELSGDIRASELVRSLRNVSSDIRFYGMGGEHLRNEGVELVHGFTGKSVVGFQEAIVSIPNVYRTFRKVYRSALDSDAVILVDYPGFHLYLASKLLKQGKKVFYYILPQVWAWGRFRMGIMRRMQGLYSILPFEKEFLSKYGIEAKYYGHPLNELYRRNIKALPRRARLVVGMLPGSRKDEVRRLIPRFLKIKRELEKLVDDVEFLISLKHEYPLPKENNLRVFEGKALEIMKTSDILVSASGTATLEAGILGKPVVVVYAISELSWYLARIMVKVKRVSLTNLILGENVYPEFIQHISARKVARSVLELLEKRSEIEEKLSKLRELLGKEDPTPYIARDIWNKLKA